MQGTTHQSLLSMFSPPLTSPNLTCVTLGHSPFSLHSEDNTVFLSAVDGLHPRPPQLPMAVPNDLRDRWDSLLVAWVSYTLARLSLCLPRLSSHAAIVSSQNITRVCKLWEPLYQCSATDVLKWKVNRDCLYKVYYMCVYIQYAFPYTHTHTHTHTRTQTNDVSWFTFRLVRCSVHEIPNETFTTVEGIPNQPPPGSRTQYDCWAHSGVSTVQYQHSVQSDYYQPIIVTLQPY